MEPREKIDECVRREFEDEACALPEEEMPRTRALLDAIFTKTQMGYKGLIDDPRQTDNAWMETTYVVVELAR